MNVVNGPSWVLAAVLSLGVVADAQRLPNTSGPARGRAAAAGAGLSPIEILNMLDAYAMLQAQETLQLADNQYSEFVPRLKRLQQTRRRNLQARNGLLQELRKLAGPQAGQSNEEVIREALRALRDHDERSAADLLKAYEGLDEVLNTRQQARFRLFEEMLERRKVDLLKRAQQGARRQ